jgi:hypothetical protein
VQRDDHRRMIAYARRGVPGSLVGVSR